MKAAMRGLGVLGLTAAACGAPADADKGAAIAAPVLAGDGKADVGTRVDVRGELGFGEAGALAGELLEDFELHGATLAVRAGAVVTLEVTRRGSSRKLDTQLYVYGPRSEANGFGGSAIALDDDSGWGRLSRLRGLALAEAGTYLVVVGSLDGQGRGSYRLTATCESGDCAPEAPPVNDAGAGACHARVAAAITACGDGWLEDPDFDPYRTTRIDLLEQCADAEVVAPAWDEVCGATGAPDALCGAGFQAFAEVELPACRRALVAAELDRSCVFGERFRDLFWHPGPVVVNAQRVLTADSPLTELERAQIVLAVHTTAHDEVTDAAQAFAVVDRHEIHQLELWDASNRHAFTAYELGAGDNSFGLYFAAGTTVTVARIGDSDLYDCTVTWGRERRLCRDDAECGDGLRCEGRIEGAGPGRCLELRRDEQPEAGASCSSDAACGAAGLICAGAASGGEGVCVPNWMRATFTTAPATPVPDGAAGGAEVQIPVFGLATVSTDVLLHLVVAHPRIADLRVTLSNPAGTEVSVFAGERDGGELYLDALVVPGFPGDESANGVWRLRVVDARRGEAGSIGEVGLTLTSRWD